MDEKKINTSEFSQNPMDLVFYGCRHGQRFAVGAGCASVEEEFSDDRNKRCIRDALARENKIHLKGHFIDPFASNARHIGDSSG
ncbi:hypothetical protein, partial [Curtobacterium sp. MMLR14_002]|uniref:hypothetical protein n=1 Tax=Curtobacterium sp. MMLR14_002 TaxID=1898741 RepID=UPI001C0BB6E2